MQLSELEKIQGATPRETQRLRVTALKEEQRNGTPPLVPRAEPPTTMAEVPPGTAQFRAAPARKPRDVDATPPAVDEALARNEAVESEGTKRFKEDAARDAEKLEADAAKNPA